MQDNILLAARYLESRGYAPYECGSEDEAREGGRAEVRRADVNFLQKIYF